MHFLTIKIFLSNFFALLRDTCFALVLDRNWLKTRFGAIRVLMLGLFPRTGEGFGHSPE